MDPKIAAEMKALGLYLEPKKQKEMDHKDGVGDWIESMRVPESKEHNGAVPKPKPDNNKYMDHGDSLGDLLKKGPAETVKTLFASNPIRGQGDPVDEDSTDLPPLPGAEIKKRLFKKMNQKSMPAVSGMLYGSSGIDY